MPDTNDRPTQMPPGNLLEQALAHHQRGMFDEAERLYRAILGNEPDNAGALTLLGTLHAQRGNFQEAVRLIERSLTLRPEQPVALSTMGIAYRGLKRLDEAVAAFDKAIALNQGFAEAYNNKAVALHELKRYAEALACCERALALQPGNPSALNNRGNALQSLKRYDEAIASYGGAIALLPHYAEAFHNRGDALTALKRFDLALMDYDVAIALNPDYAEAFNSRGNALKNLGRVEEALASFERAALLKPDFAEAYNNRGILFAKIFDWGRAFLDFDKAYGLNPELEYVEGWRLHAKMHMCDWAGLDEEMARLAAHVREARRATEPFMLLPTTASAADQLACAAIYTADKFPPAPAPLWRGERYSHDRIRVGYVSGEFRAQATAYLTADLFECHDRSRFELYAISSGADDASPTRQRLQRAFDVFVDVAGKSDAEVAALIRAAEIDILVNLNGYFGLDRTEVFAMRAAPVQVNYLGFPGTMGAPYMDYIIADRHLIPYDRRMHYSEKPVYLPDSYQPNDRKKPASAKTFTRAQCGLPENGVVFCCFNNHHKILPLMFDVWMRILAAVEGSVLWLLEGDAVVRRNLEHEAEKRGIPAARLVFAPFMAFADHMAREVLADLFLDTLPHNAHTTASDALWCGVPVVTCVGETFAARVASSLLSAVGLPELITVSLEDYEALAIALARDPARLAALKAKLTMDRGSAPLFDTPRYTRHLEAAYAEMLHRQRHGDPPESFNVP
jgi:predicted O-linked N-acetylglucosamine transferase (SPINDLY family)